MIKQNKAIKSLIILMIILSNAPIVASAVTPDIYVNTTGWWRAGGAFNASSTRIQAAINNAAAGDTIYVYNGSYTENVNVNKRVTLQGEGAGVVNVTAASASDHVFDVTTAYVNISGFKVTGATDSSQAGIFLNSGVDHGNISDNNASNNQCGIYLSSSSNNTLTNNTANSNTNYGISLSSSSNNTLTSNTANSNTNYGILLISSSNNNTLTSNNASNNSYGIYLSVSSNNNTLTNNSANSNTNYGIFLQSSSNNNTLTSNTASNNTYGIYLYLSSNNTIYNNYFNNTNNADDNGYNVWNTTITSGTNIIGGSSLGGNYWSNYAGADTTGDGLGDTLIPYKGSITNGGDYHPLTTTSTIDIYVNTTGWWRAGGAFNASSTRIQAAIDNATDGDTIYVNAGNYSENVNVNQAVTLQGAGAGVVTVTNSTANNHVFNVSADYVNISGFKVTGATSSGKAGIYLSSNHSNISDNNASNNYYGIYLTSSSNNTLTSNTANSNSQTSILLYSSSNNNTLTSNNASNNYYGIFLQSSSNNNTLTNNTANSNNQTGILLQSSNNNTLTNNTANSNPQYGIFLQSSSNNNTLTNNTAKLNSNYGIYLISSSNNTLTNNNASNNDYGIYLQSSSNNNTLTNNTANSNTQYGIYLQSSSNNNTLTNNTANSNIPYGIYLASSSNNTLTNNNASNNNYGIYLYSSSNNTLTNNTANSNAIGIYLRYSNNNNTLTNNNASNNSNGIILELSSNNNTIYNNYFNNTNNAYDDGYNVWNTTKTAGTNIIGGSWLGGNYWSNYTGEDTDSDGLGNTLTPYNSSGNITNGGDYNPLAAVGGPSTFYVNETGWWRAGGAFNASSTRIQAAIDNATDGDTIYVYAGNYSENVNVYRAVTLQGEGADVVNVTAASSSDHVFEVTVDYVNISGFKVTGATGSDKAGIFLGSGVDHGNISDNNANSNVRGIFLYSSSNNTLTNNNANSNTQYGIVLESSSNNNTLTNNTANSNVWYGIFLLSSSNNNLTNNTASNNYRGIWLQSSSNNNLTNNTASNNTASNNNGGAGIWLSSSSNNNTLTNNTANSNSDYGIVLQTSSNNTIYNNYFNNTNNAYDDGYNVWNTTITEGTNIVGGSYLGGNYWSNYAGEDTDGDRLGDTLTPYNNSITHGGDYHPLMNVDTTAPSITIISPVNTTYSNTSILLNVTTNQTANVTYSLNGGTNLSLYNLTTSGNNTITGTEGTNNITVYANDSAGNLNYSSVNFTIDTIAPSITIISPVNTTYNNDSILLNVTTNQTANVTYSLNGGTNLSLYNLTTSGNTTITGTEGANNITVYANDSAGNLNSSIVYFIVDTTTPPASITNLTANAYAQTYINWTWTDPADSDFSNVSVYLNDIFQANVTNGTQYFYASSLAAGTGYTIGTRTVDTYGNTNTTWENNTQTTSSSPPPDPYLNTITVSPSAATVASGASKVFTATARDQYGNTMGVSISWTSSNTTVGTVGNTGIFIANKTGTSTIKAASGSVSGSSTVTVVSGELTNISVLPDNTTLNISQTQQFNATGIDANGNAVSIAPVWNSSNTSVGAINATTGVFTAMTAGTASITAINGSISANATVTVLASTPPPSTGVPVITGFSPSSPVIDIAGSSRTFNLTANQTVDVTWYINGSQVSTNPGVTEADYTNTNAASGTWNVTAIAGNANGTVSQEWIWIVTTPSKGAPVITGFSPSSPVIDIAGSTRIFSLTANQIVDVTWYINGSQVSTNPGVTEANYTNINAISGTWNVTAIAGNANGTVSQEWIWIVGTVVTDVMPPVITISVPVNNTNISIFDGIISGSITDDSNITANMYVNSVFNNTWTSKGSFRWLYNFTKNDYNTIKISAVDAYGNYNESIIRVFVLPPVSETFVNLTANESVNITVNASTGADVELATGNHTANVSLKINASTNASDFNASDIDTEFVALGIAKKSLIKFIEINATGEVANLSSVKLTIFYRDPDLDMNGNEIIDAGDQKEDTLNLYWYWDNATGKQEWFPLTLGADYSDKIDRANKSGPIVISVEKNTTLNYISVTMNHFTTFSIAGELIPATTTTNTTTTSNNGSSGSIGSSVITAEPLENIAYSEMIGGYLEAGKPVTYTFSKNQDVVYEVSVIGKETENNVAMRIEILKDISKQVTEAASGLVYRNVNIILGTDKTGENVIKFKVNDSWLIENDLNSSDIRLVEWVDNKWITLEIGLLFNKDGYTHFSAKSQTFSIYAITGIKNEKIIPAPLATEKTAITQEAMPLKTEVPTLQTEKKTLFWFWMILAVLLVAALVYALKKR